MDVYGLTGGIGSGKSTVAELLEDYGIPVVSADELSRVVVAKGSDGLEAVVQCFGAEVLDDNGELDRRKMAAMVFEDPAKRRALESILHPRIRERFEQVLDALEKAGHEVAVYEVPLLFEKNLQGEMKAVILVTADERVRIDRVVHRDGVTEAEVLARMATQLDETTKRKRADYVIENNGSMDELRREVEFLLARFLRVGTSRTNSPAIEEVPVKTGRTLPPLEGEPRARIPTEIPSGGQSTGAAPYEHRGSSEPGVSEAASPPSSQRTEIPSQRGQTMVAPPPSPDLRRASPGFSADAGAPARPASPGSLGPTTPNVPPVPHAVPAGVRRDHSSPLPINPPGVPSAARRQSPRAPAPAPPNTPSPSKPATRPAAPPPTPVPAPPTASTGGASSSTGQRELSPSRRRTQTMRTPVVPEEPIDDEGDASEG